MSRIFIGAIIALVISLSINAYNNTIQAQNDTETETVATGQETVVVQAQNGTVVDVAPAEAVSSLLGYIQGTWIPIVISLIIAVTGLLKVLPLNKKQREWVDHTENVAKYVDTESQKVNEQYIVSGAFKSGFDLVADTLEQLKPGSKDRIIKALEPVPDVERKFRENAAQIEEFRKRLPNQMQADTDKEIPRIADGDIR